MAYGQNFGKSLKQLLCKGGMEIDVFPVHLMNTILERPVANIYECAIYFYQQGINRHASLGGLLFNSPRTLVSKFKTIVAPTLEVEARLLSKILS